MKNSDTARENAGILSEIDSAGSKNASYTYGSERTSKTDSTETSYYLYDGRDRQNGEYASNAELGIESGKKEYYRSTWEFTPKYYDQLWICAS